MTGPSVCVTLEGTTVKEMADEAARANIAGADFVEIRFDYLYLKKPQPTTIEDENGDTKQVMPPSEEWPVQSMESVDVHQSIEFLKESIPLPVIFTVRPTSEGGFFPGSEEERINVITQAIQSNVTMVDLELSIDEQTRATLVSQASSNDVKVISSIHNLETTPSAEDIIELVNQHATEHDIFKFCGTVNDHQDALQVVEACHALKTSTKKYALMALGDGGDWARLHAPILGQSMVYATLKNEFKLSAKGLVNIKDLRNAWNLMEY